MSISAESVQSMTQEFLDYALSQGVPSDHWLVANFQGVAGHSPWVAGFLEKSSSGSVSMITSFGRKTINTNGEYATSIIQIFLCYGYKMPPQEFVTPGEIKKLWTNSNNAYEEFLGEVRLHPTLGSLGELVPEIARQDKNNTHRCGIPYRDGQWSLRCGDYRLNHERDFRLYSGTEEIPVPLLGKTQFLKRAEGIAASLGIKLPVTTSKIIQDTESTLAFPEEMAFPSGPRGGIV